MSTQNCNHLPTITVASLLKDKGLTYGQLANRFSSQRGVKISRQAIGQVVRGEDNSSDVRVFLAGQLGFKPSTLFRGLVADDLLALDDFKFSRDQ